MAELIHISLSNAVEFPDSRQHQPVSFCETYKSEREHEIEGQSLEQIVTQVVRIK